MNSKGLEIIESAERLALAEMQNLVGNPGVSAYIEVAYYNSFSDKAISLIGDDEFLRKEINSTCKTCKGDIIYGQVVILGTSLEAEDFALLTKEQTDINSGNTGMMGSDPLGVGSGGRWNY